MIGCRYHLLFGVIGSIPGSLGGKVRILNDSKYIKLKFASVTAAVRKTVPHQQIVRIGLRGK